MTDREQTPAAALGRVMSWIGSLWVAFAVLWGLGIAEAVGLSGSIASGLGRTIFPALVLIGVGRAVRRRARNADDSLQPDVSRAPLPTPPILPRTDTYYEPPRPPTTIAPKPPRPIPPPEKAAGKPLEVVAISDQAPDPASGQELPIRTPKTSQELIEEARRRWGTRP